MIPAHNEHDEIIVVEEKSELEESGYFYLENRQFKGPYDSPKKAQSAALENCTGIALGECRAVYQGTVRYNFATELREPLADMHQVQITESDPVN